MKPLSELDFENEEDIQELNECFKTFERHISQDILINLGCVFIKV